MAKVAQHEAAAHRDEAAKPYRLAGDHHDKT